MNERRETLMKSTHIPEFAGNISLIPSAGSLVVNTHLRSIQSASAVLAQDAVGTAASVSIVIGDPPEGGNQTITIKTWAADGATAGSTAAKVSWLALGQ